MKLASEALEGSNVNPVDAMVNAVSLARQFEMQVKNRCDGDNMGGDGRPSR